MTLRSGMILGLASLVFGGCQTSRSFAAGCHDVYSGVRYYNDQVGELPVGGKIFFALALPFTAVMDTLLLPATAFLEPKRPTTGCGIVDPRIGMRTRLRLA